MLRPTKFFSLTKTTALFILEKIILLKFQILTTSAKESGDFLFEMGYTNLKGYLVLETIFDFFFFSSIFCRGLSHEYSS